jgi:hypothetical protein
VLYITYYFLLFNSIITVGLLPHSSPFQKKNVLLEADTRPGTRQEFNPLTEEMFNLLDAMPKRRASYRVVAEQIINYVLSPEQF